MALKKKQSTAMDDRNFCFDIIEIANLLNKSSGYIKRELKQLQWTQTEGNVFDMLVNVDICSGLFVVTDCSS